jgi:VanZ family protein
LNPKRFSTWLPPLVWMAIVFGFSSSAWSAEHTSGLLLPVFRWLMPWATPAQLAMFHGLARKAAHVIEYGILAALWFRTFVRSGWLSVRGAHAGALTIAVLCAVADELHQSTVPSRTGSPTDVLIDAGGGVLALVISAYGWRLLGAVTSLLFWIAAVGGLGFLVLNRIAGVDSGPLWVTTPVAIAALVILKLGGLKELGGLKGPPKPPTRSADVGEPDARLDHPPE